MPKKQTKFELHLSLLQRYKLLEKLATKESGSMYEYNRWVKLIGMIQIDKKEITDIGGSFDDKTGQMNWATDNDKGRIFDFSELKDYIGEVLTYLNHVKELPFTWMGIASEHYGIKE